MGVIKMAVRKGISGSGVWLDDGTYWNFTVNGTIPMRIRQSDNRLELEGDISDNEF